MRGVVVFFTGLFVITAITMFAGMLIEPFIDVAADNPAVQDMGWDNVAEDIGDTILRWMSIFFIAYLLAWGAVWYLRQERLTTVRR